MFNPEKDFSNTVLEALGRDGKSINALSKELETRGIKHHRLLLTGYLRALADKGYLTVMDVPPAKVYKPVKTNASTDNIYRSVERAVRKAGLGDACILYVLNRLFKRPVFESELRVAGVINICGEQADAQTVNDCRKILKKEGNIIPSDRAYVPIEEFPDKYQGIITEALLEAKSCRYLVMESTQSRLL